MPKTKKEDRTIRRILVPTDFSDTAAKALEYAIGLARIYKADLFLAHVIEPFPYKLYGFLEGSAGIGQGALVAETQSLLDRLSKKVTERGLSVEIHLAGGIPYREIVNWAKRGKIDLIVMGTEGRTGMDRFMMGSVAEKVTRLAPCPVLTVPLPFKTKESQAPKRKIKRTA